MLFWSIAGAVFIATFFFIYGLAVSWASRNKVKVRLGNPATILSTSLLLKKEKPSRLRERSMEWLAFYGQWALPNLDKVSQMRKCLIQAGYRHPKAPAVYLGLRVVAAFTFPLPLLLFYIMRGKLGLPSLFMALCLSIIGFHLPAHALGVKVKGRQERLDRALPDILDLFVIAMDAGLSLNAALQRVAEEIRGVFDDFFEELQITAAELCASIPWDEAFDNLAKRTGVQSIRSMVSLMTQSGKLGGSIGDALRHHAEFVRTQRILRAEEKAAKLPVKMVLPMIFCIFPAILIVVIGPGLIHIFEKFLKSGISLGGPGPGGFGGF